MLDDETVENIGTLNEKLKKEFASVPKKSIK